MCVSMRSNLFKFVLKKKEFFYTFIQLYKYILLYLYIKLKD